jgi:guanosine-3',5'-bis(diphosphate) 3'-pyrophosphohydrolase
MNDIIRIARALDFAARKHVDQRRKGERQEPYINHLAEVARMLAEVTGGNDPDLVIAGLLHDCIEDQGVSPDELGAAFGKTVAGIVREVTDDKKLAKEVRKQLQVETAPKKSPQAKMLKIADKTSNLRAILASPPDWPIERKHAYFAWASRVVAGCRGVNAELEAMFDAARQRGVEAGFA